VTLRQALGGDVTRLHELLEDILDREDVVVLLFDGNRAVNYISGFGLSPSQHELTARALERMVRDFDKAAEEESNHASHEFDSSGH
jgi:hypothetical protein